MRSQIACERCRRSKVKCNNNGIYSICQACAATGRECRYTESSTGGRRESVVARQPASSDRVASQDTGPRKRQKRQLAPTTQNPTSNGRDSPSTIDALDPSILTPKVWKELYEIYQRHFASDIPFVHGPTFRRLVHQSGDQPSSPVQGYSPLFLLAFLALTSRFHKDLIKTFGPQAEKDPLSVAEFYASETRKHMEATSSTNHGDSHTLLERAQADLMLCLHQWGMLQGMKARLSLSTAIYTANLAGLHSKLNLDEMKLKRTQALDPDIEFPQITQTGLHRRTRSPPEYSLTDNEIHHRTFWSCFIMDRYLAGGYGRSKQIHVDSSCVPLPISDHAFEWRQRTTTLPLIPRPSPGQKSSREGNGAAVELGWHKAGRLSPTINGSGPHATRDARLSIGNHELPEKLEAGQTEGGLSCFVRALDLYSDVIGWSCAGGRRTEGSKPPWDPDTEFSRLNDALDSFTQDLPDELRLSENHTSGHSDSKSPTHYILMHIALLLCSIMLHREYVPFLPYICPKPEGPLDEPLIKEKPPNPLFWENSARKCFRAARELIDLICKYQEWGMLVETPLTAFAVFQVCITAMWCQAFPQMDPDRDMCAKRQTDNQHPATAARILWEMRTRLKMARDWCTTIRKTHRYFASRTKEYEQYKQTKQKPDAEADDGSSPTPAYRNGQGGLDEYISLERLFKDFGVPYDEDREVDNEIPDIDWEATDKTECGSESSRGGIHEESQKPPPVPPAGFNAINASSAMKAESPGGSLISPNANNNHAASIHSHASPPNATPRGGYGQYHESPSHIPHQHQVHQYPAAALSADRQSLQMHHHATQAPEMVSMYHQQQHPMSEQQLAYQEQQYVNTFYAGPSWGTVEVATFVEGQPSRNCNFVDENVSWLSELNKV